MAAAESAGNSAGRPTQADIELTIAAASKAADKALQAGARAPLFTLEDTDGQQVSLEEMLSSGPVVLHFSRGAWCAFGERNLAEFESLRQEVAALGASAVAIAPPGKAAAQGHPPGTRELRDAGMKVARMYGLAFELPASLRPKYEALGYVPPSTGTHAWLVPLPATYLLDREGNVVFAFIDVDYRKRFEPEWLLSALRALQARHNELAGATRLRL